MEETGRQWDECPHSIGGQNGAILDRVTHSCLRVINSPDGRSIPTRVVWSPDGHFVAGACTHYGARVWDAETGEVFEVTEEPQHVATLAIDSNLNLAVIGWQVPPRSSDPNAPRHLETKTWDIATKRQLSSFWRGGIAIKSSNAER